MHFSSDINRPPYEVGDDALLERMTKGYQAEHVTTPVPIRGRLPEDREAMFSLLNG